MEDHFEPPEDPNLECGAIAHASKKAKAKRPLSETEATTEKKTNYQKDKLQATLTNKEFQEHCGNFYIFDGKDWYVSDYDYDYDYECDWDQENDRWFMTSGHRALLVPIGRREYDDLRKCLSDPNSMESKVEKAMAEDAAGDTKWQATWRKMPQQRNTKLEAGKRRHAVMEKQKGEFIPKRLKHVSLRLAHEHNRESSLLPI